MSIMPPDPDSKLDTPAWGPSRFQYEVCVSSGHWGIDGFTVLRDSTGRRWFMYGPCDEFGMARTLTEARRLIRNGEVPQ